MMLEEFVEKHKRLLELERQEEINNSKILNEFSPKILEEKNLCIRKLSLLNISTGLYGRTILEFESKHKREESSKSVFSQGDIIGVYNDCSKSDVSKALATGLFYKSNKDSIQIALDNNLENEEMLNVMDENLFRLVKLSSEVTYSRLKSGLKYLEKRSKPFCGDYLVDILLSGLAVSSTKSLQELKFINKNLNSSQKDAVQFALARSDVAVVHGPPGTGKTTVAVEIINQILDTKIGHKTPKILVCTPSNIALDNLAEKLLKSQPNRRDEKLKADYNNGHKLNLLRLGHSVRVMPHLSDISLDYKLSICDQAELIAQVRSQIDSTLKRSLKKSDKIRHDRRWELSDLRKELRERELKAVREVLSCSNVIMSTLTGLRSNKSLPLNEIEFDVVLIDEASQAIEAACWLAIPRGKKLILAGDHKQLPPTVLSDEALKQGLGLSLMERLLDLYPGKEITRMLSSQYRMNESIMRWSSDTFYNSELSADETVRQHTLMDIFTDYDQDNCDPLGPLTFIDTSGCELYELESTQEDSKANVGEAQLAAVYIQQLVNRFKLKPNHIGVITPYSRQVQLIREAMKNRMASSEQNFDFNQVEVSTVDGFQGREKEIIVTTLVRSNPSGTIGFLSEHRRLNVALTRAKRHLCVIGDSSTIEQSGDKVLGSLIKYWDDVAEVRSAHEYIYEHDISPGNCVKQKKAAKPNDNKKLVKPRSEGDIELENRVCDQLRSFKLDENETRLEFSSKLNSRIRAILHDLADSLQLHHESVGEGKNRKLIIHKTRPIKQLETIEIECISSKSTLDTPHKDDLSIINENTDEVNVISEDNQDPCPPIKEDIVEPIENLKNITENLTVLKEQKKSGEIVSNNKPASDIRFENNLSDLIESKSAQLDNAISQLESKSNQKSFAKSKKKTTRPKSTKESLGNIPDDLDEMLEHFQSLNKVCQYSGKCSTGVSILGFNCQFCKKRFCSAHMQPEIHLCPLANRTAWRQLESTTKPMSNSKKIRHNQLSRAMNQKLQDLSSNRKSHKKDEKN